MKDLKGKSVLLFCPVFFNYEKEIKSVLEGLGAKVIWFDDRPSNDFLSKSLIRINKNFLKNKINIYYQNILKQVGGEEFDYLFFVNPESISFESLSKLKEAFPKAKSILYMWDSFKNRKQNLELLPLFTSKFTFDPHDAAKYGLKLRPLFYTDAYSQKETKEIHYDFLFVGTAHSDRYTFVKKLLDANGIKNFKLYFYLSSKLLFLFKRLFDRSFKLVKYKDVSFKSLSHSDISGFMSESKVVLDINHPNQIGLTMRTLETLGVQRKLVTTNKDILKYDFYNEANILLIDRENPKIDGAFFESPFLPSDSGTMFKYSIGGWTSEIFELV
ncbi:hypothetical protein [Pedobacter sp. NJ-S-72]